MDFASANLGILFDAWRLLYQISIANIGDFFGTSWGVNGADSAAFFKGFYTDPVQTVAFTVIFVFLTVLITSVGVSKGIEKFSAIAMPALFVMLCIVIVRSERFQVHLKDFAFVFSLTLMYSREQAG